MSNPVFSDYELRRCIDQIGFRSVDSYGGDSRAWKIAKHVRDTIEASQENGSLEAVWAESVPWQEETFPQATPKSIVAHLLREAQELSENPDDWEEVADILLLVGHLLHKTGLNAAKITRDKLLKNMQRKWGEPDAEGVVEHIREENDPTLLINIFAEAVEMHDNLLTKFIEGESDGGEQSHSAAL
jgi:predicted house-cleaning noncanonical NTP pyrophosphatase (MazG superfamily)